MSPEYLVHGHLTEKVDVYAFGVLVLEIISGRRNKTPMDSNDIPSLLTMVWKYHLLGTVSSIIDPNIQENNREVLKVVHIALLCTQASATLRPSMSEVIMFLTSKDPNLQEASEPPFIDVIHLRSNINTSVSSSHSNSKTSISLNHSHSNTRTNISPTLKTHNVVSNIASSLATPMSLNTISTNSFGPR
jgi:serine/threonine protein kinase